MTSKDIERLIQHGHHKGSLSIADIQEHVPLDTMTASQIGDLMAALESAGVEVEVDAELLSPRPEATRVVEAKPVLPEAKSPRTGPRASPIDSAASEPPSHRTSVLDIRPSLLYVRRAPATFVVIIVIILLGVAALIWHVA